MEKFVWSDEYSVGIPETDEDHKKFFDIANHLIDLLEKKDVTKENLVLAVDRIGEYANTHFKEEEDMFDTENYREAPQHTAAHELYRRRVNYYMRALHEPDADIRQLASEIATFSIYWLSDHILLMDKQYTIFLKQKNS